MLSIVLSRRDFRENDQIISLYTKEKGKLELLARGIKKITSKHSAQVEPFSVVDIEIAKGKEIDHLTKVQLVEYFSHIRKDLEKSTAAGYVVLLVDRMTQTGERDEGIFELLDSWLKFIDNVDSFNAVLVDGYMAILLYCLGFAPELKRCVVCGVEQVAGLYPAGGGIVCAACKEKKKKLREQVLDCSVEQVKNLGILLSGEWQLINNLRFEADEYEPLHNLVYEYAVFHSEKKLADYVRFDKIIN